VFFPCLKIWGIGSFGMKLILDEGKGLKRWIEWRENNRKFYDHLLGLWWSLAKDKLFTGRNFHEIMGIFHDENSDFPLLNQKTKQ
jgi:hypothetical protein